MLEIIRKTTVFPCEHLKIKWSGNYWISDYLNHPFLVNYKHNHKQLKKTYLETAGFQKYFSLSG